LTILQLIFEFMKIGLFAVGGGMATLPFLYELANKYPWFTALELTDMIAVSESTPGPIGVNMATFAGYRAAGIPGGIIAVLALIFPSIVIIILISMFLKRFHDSKLVQGGFYLIRPATAGLIAGAIFEVFIISLFNLDLYNTTNVFTDLFRWIAIAMFIVLFVVIKKLPKLHPIFFLFVGAAMGIIFKL
jgi:chromate transporter